jgi:hypothetical protein
MIRRHASVGDWVVGMGGKRLKATGHCIFAMRVTEKASFNDYWTSPRFLDKRPVRNGSQKMMVGDNIYYFDEDAYEWNQADSHHSNADGSINRYNLTRDTHADNVLVSRHFFYFGSSAPSVPSRLLNTLGYKNSRSYRVFDAIDANGLINWLQSSFSASLNQVMSDPFDFEESHKRYSAVDNKIR